MSGLTNSDLTPAKERDSLKLQVGALQNALKEFVGGSLWNPYLDIIRSLPRHTDDVERDFGLDIYDKRMITDPAVSGAVDTIVDLVFSNGSDIVPCVTSSVLSSQEDQSQANEALNAANYVKSAISQMEVPFEDVIQAQLYDALTVGCKLAEVVFQPGTIQGKTAYTVRALDLKPREVFRFIVDRHNRLLSILAIIPGLGLTMMEGMIPDPEALPNTISPSKFLLLTMPGRNRDPRGKSRLRPAYNSWWLKQQAWVGLLQWLVQMAGGWIWGELPEGAMLDPNLPGSTVEEQHALAMQVLRSGAFVAVKNGGAFHVERPDGDGSQFWTSIDGYDRQTWTAILTQARSNKEAEHGSKADSSTGQDLTDALVKRIRGTVTRSVENQFFHLILEINKGKEYADQYCPRLHLEGQTDSDVAEMVTAMGTVGIVPTAIQKAQMMEKAGFSPDLAGFQEQEKQQQANAEAAAKQPDPASKNEAA